MTTTRQLSIEENVDRLLWNSLRKYVFNYLRDNNIFEHRKCKYEALVISVKMRKRDEFNIEYKKWIERFESNEYAKQLINDTNDPIIITIEESDKYINSDIVNLHIDSIIEEFTRDYYIYGYDN